MQDDGAISIPEVGRVQVVGLTVQEAEASVFKKLVENQIDPTFSLEVAGFNSQKVSIGGSVRQPTIVPITLRPLTLDVAMAAVGGIEPGIDPQYVTIRIYRNGSLYQVPLSELYAKSEIQKTLLVDGDSIFVDNTFDLAQAQAYFAEQIQRSSERQSNRQAALAELDSVIGLRRNEFSDERDNFQARLELDAVHRDFVYLTGEVGKQGRYPLPFGNVASLADAIYGQGEGIPTETGNVSQIYVLRASADPREFGATTAWRLDARNATNLLLATRFELRPNDVIFIAEQPVTRWARVVNQLTPTLVGLGVTSATGN